MFSRAKRGLQAITAKSKDSSDQERKVAKNVITSLATTLQELSINFRRSQSNYLKSKPNNSQPNSYYVGMFTQGHPPGNN